MREYVVSSFALMLLSCAGGSGGERPMPGEPTSQSEPALLTLDLEARKQTLEGFGAAVAWYDNWLTEHPNRDQLYQVVFHDLGLDILRLRNRFRYQPDFGEGLESVDIVRGARESLGRDITVLLSSWSPPRNLKANAQEDCRAGDSGPCTLRRENGEFAYAAFADYWRDSLAAYRELGIDPKFISIQNEPDYSPDGWEGCMFAPEETDQLPSYGRALGEVHARLAELDEPPLTIGPETISLAAGKVHDYAEGMNLDQLYGIAHHLYNGNDWTEPDTFSRAMQSIHRAYPDHPVFQTEFSADSPDGAMFETAWLIHNSLVDEGAVAYVYWDLVWTLQGGLVGLEFPGDPEHWQSEDGYTIRDPYYAVRHFARFTDPGYVRVGLDWSSDDVRGSAFESPDESRVTLVVLNIAFSEHEAVFDLGDLDTSDTRIFTSTKEAPWKKRGALPEDQTLELPARSITTVVIER